MHSKAFSTQPYVFGHNYSRPKITTTTKKTTSIKKRPKLQREKNGQKGEDPDGSTSIP
jgi:hypothetical protein